MHNKVFLFLSVCVVTGLLVGGCDRPHSDVVAFDPSGDDVAVSRANLTVEFDRAMDAGTFDSSSFQVVGELSGTHTGTFAFPEPHIASFTTDKSFMYGELVKITLTDDIESISGKTVRETVHEFRIEPEPAPTDPVVFDLDTFTPAPNSIGATTTGAIDLGFTTLFNPFTIDSNTVRVVGERSGAREISFNNLFVNLEALDMQMNRPFVAGERVTVALDSRIRSADGDSLEAAIYHFMVANGESSWGEAAATGNTVTNNVTVLMGDVDGDSRDEWVVVGDNGSLQVQELLSDETVSPSTTLQLGTNVLSAALGDFDADGRADLVCLTPTALYVFGGRDAMADLLGNLVQIPLGTFDGAAIAAGHFDEDGVLDLFMTASDPNDGARICWGGTSSALQSHHDFPTFNAVAPAVCGDFDGDLLNDLAYLDAAGNAHVEFGLGSRAFEAGPELVPSNPAVELHAVALDAANTPAVLLVPALGAAATLFEGQSNGGFNAFDLQAGQTSPGMAIVDFDGDNSLDLLAPNGNDVNFFLNLGDATFPVAADQSQSHAAAIEKLVFGDVNGDGNLDFSLDMNGQWELRLSGAVIPVFGDTLTIPALSGNAGDTLSFAVNANHDDSIEGYTVIFGFDPAIVTVDSLTAAGTDAAGVGVELEMPGIDAVNGTATLAVIFDFLPPFDGQVLAPGADHSLVAGSLTIDADTTENSTQLRFENGLGSPAVDNIFVVGGFSVLPTLTSGTVTINTPVVIPVE